MLPVQSTRPVILLYFTFYGSLKRQWRRWSLLHYCCSGGCWNFPLKKLSWWVRLVRLSLLQTLLANDGARWEVRVDTLRAGAVPSHFEVCPSHIHTRDLVAYTGLLWLHYFLEELVVWVGDRLVKPLFLELDVSEDALDVLLHFIDIGVIDSTKQSHRTQLTNSYLF